MSGIKEYWENSGAVFEDAALPTEQIIETGEEVKIDPADEIVVIANGKFLTDSDVVVPPPVLEEPAAGNMDAILPATDTIE